MRWFIGNTIQQQTIIQDKGNHELKQEVYGKDGGWGWNMKQNTGKQALRVYYTFEIWLNCKHSFGFPWAGSSQF